MYAGRNTWTLACIAWSGGAQGLYCALVLSKPEIFLFILISNTLVCIVNNDKDQQSSLGALSI